MSPKCPISALPVLNIVNLVSAHHVEMAGVVAAVLFAKVILIGPSITSDFFCSKASLPLYSNIVSVRSCRSKGIKNSTLYLFFALAS